MRMTDCSGRSRLVTPGPSVMYFLTGPTPPSMEAGQEDGGVGGPGLMVPWSPVWGPGQGSHCHQVMRLWDILTGRMRRLRCSTESLSNTIKFTGEIQTNFESIIIT